MPRFNQHSNGGFEKRSLERVDIDLAYERAKKVLVQDAIDPKSLPGSHSMEEVERDLLYVEGMERKFSGRRTPEEEKTQEIATTFEAVIHEQGELNDWLGPDAHTIKASRYDDIKNGVDVIVEFRSEVRETSHLALGIDVTFSPDIAGKLQKNKDQIKNGVLPHVKYFNSQGGLPEILEVVIGSDIKTVQELIPLWMGKDNKVLQRHRIQFLILEEIRMQLKAFENYARREKQEHIASKYHDALKIIEEIIEAKKGLLKETGVSTEELKEDDVFRMISNYIKNLEKSGT